ncbi:MAG TPA: diadenylate cyclase [Acidimicrobiales bacterium]|nr:diadenylate cyclase [Acidimicrobiales bacterium]
MTHASISAGLGARRRQRLEEELEESGLPGDGDDPLRRALIEEVDYALRPPVHERRISSSGTILAPSTDPAAWAVGTELRIARLPIAQYPARSARQYADGLSSWLLRHGHDHPDEWLLFDRPAGSERDLVVLANVLGATIVQRHPSGAVRVVGDFGVLRWEGFSWYHEPPVSSWVDLIAGFSSVGDAKVLKAMLAFAVHDLGSLGIGALLVYRAGEVGEPAAHRSASLVEDPLPTPPPLNIRAVSHLAPLRHALAQVDGAAVFSRDGVLRRLGARLVPSPEAVTAVAAEAALGGTRHTSGLRYTYDDPESIVIAVSEDGPVSILRQGQVLGRSVLAGSDGSVP